MAQTCVIAGCTRQQHVARGWCSTHYWRFKQYGDPTAAVEPRIPSAPDGRCAIEDCSRVNFAGGLCQWHYVRRDGAHTCTLNGCDKPLRARGWCLTHYMRWRRYGEPGAAAPLRVWKYSGADCLIPACDRAAVGNGMCERHYMRLVGAPKRRARLRAVPNFVITDRDSVRVLTSPCLACGSQTEVTADHIIPISRGGSHGIGNLIPLCRPCNTSKHALTWMEWRVSGRPRAGLIH